MEVEADYLRSLYEKYESDLNRHEAAAKRAMDRADETRVKLDGLRLILSEKGIDLAGDGLNGTTQQSQVRSYSTTGLTPAIIEMLPILPGAINTPNVVEALRARDPDLVPQGRESSVSSALGRLYERDVLRLIESAAGRRPATYELVIEKLGEPLSDAPASNQGGDDDI